MTLLTAFEIAYNYPDNILISTSSQSTGKVSAFCYRLKNKEIHKLLLSTEPIFDTEQEAKDAIHELAEQCKKLL